MATVSIKLSALLLSITMKRLKEVIVKGHLATIDRTSSSLEPRTKTAALVSRYRFMYMFDAYSCFFTFSFVSIFCTSCR